MNEIICYKQYKGDFNGLFNYKRYKFNYYLIYNNISISFEEDELTLNGNFKINEKIPFPINDFKKEIIH